MIISYFASGLLDVVKKVRLPENHELFIISLIEHKSYVDYNVVMQLLRYMVYIWEDYEKNAQKMGDMKPSDKNFRYPPILPIVYYEGTGEWTAVTNFADRVFLNDIFAPYIPDFTYHLFRLREHEQEELMEKKDAISVIMLINRLRNMKEFHELQFPDGYFEDLSEKTPQDALEVLAKVMAVLLRELNVPEEEVMDFTDQIKERRMGRLFEGFQGYDWQATRRESLAEGRKKGREEGREEGREQLLIEQVCKKLRKGKDAFVIAEELDEDFDKVDEIIQMAESYAPTFDPKEIWEKWLKEKKKESVVV